MGETEIEIDRWVKIAPDRVLIYSQQREKEEKEQWKKVTTISAH